MERIRSLTNTNVSAEAISKDDSCFLEALLDSDLSGTSNAVLQYETEVSTFFESNYCLATSSGTAALLLALHALGISDGDEVLIAPTCPLCTVYAILAVRGVPVFCDIRQHNFGLDLEDAKTLISNRVRALVDVPMWGYPTPVDELKKFACEHKVPVILDLAHCHGTMLHGTNLSSYADIACFSTHNCKVLSTGEGGFLVTDKGDLYERARLYSRFGDFNGEDFGLNYKIGSLQAAIGERRLESLHIALNTRKRNRDYLMNTSLTASIDEFPIIPGGEPNYYCLLLRTKDNASSLIQHLASHNIPSDITRFRCKALYKYPLLMRWYRACPNAERMLSTITTVPLSPTLKQKDLLRIRTALREYRP